MSADLHDLRAKISPLAHCALEAVSRATGRERSEIVREILDAWAEEKRHEANVLHALLRVEGLAGIGQGTPGNRGEPQGFVPPGHRGTVA